MLSRRAISKYLKQDSRGVFNGCYSNISLEKKEEPQNTVHDG